MLMSSRPPSSTNDVLSKLRMCAAPRTTRRRRSAARRWLHGATGGTCLGAPEAGLSTTYLSAADDRVSHAAPRHLDTPCREHSPARGLHAWALPVQTTQAKDGRVSLNCLARIYSCWPHLAAYDTPSVPGQANHHRAPICRRRELLVRLWKEMPVSRYRKIPTLINLREWPWPKPSS